MSMTCTGACLGERGLVAIDTRTDRKQKEPRRALSPDALQRQMGNATVKRNVQIVSYSDRGVQARAVSIWYRIGHFYITRYPPRI